MQKDIKLKINHQGLRCFSNPVTINIANSSEKFQEGMSFEIFDSRGDEISGVVQKIISADKENNIVTFEAHIPRFEKAKPFNLFAAIQTPLLIVFGFLLGILFWG
jgi:hypothetical protein